jgi:hypothetical protein
VTLSLYVAAALGVLLPVAFLLDAVQDTDEHGMAFIIYMSVALAFYAALGVFARPLSVARGRRWVMAVCVLLSLSVIAASGGPTGLIVFGPSTAILAWLAIRG